MIPPDFHNRILEEMKRTGKAYGDCATALRRRALKAKRERAVQAGLPSICPQTAGQRRTLPSRTE